MKMREIIGTIGIVKFLILMLASTSWIMVQHFPYVPIGLLVILYFVGKQELKVYLPFIVMSVIGFMGTGIYFNTYSTTRTMLATGKTFNSQHFGISYRWGMGILTYLLKDDRVVIFNDGKLFKEIALGQAYIKELESSLLENNSTFMLESFVYQNGVTKSKVEEKFNEMQKGKWLLDGHYLGYLYWVYPKKMNHKEISLFYKINFEKNGKKYTTAIYRLVLDENQTKLTQFDALEESRQLKIEK